MRLPKDLLSGNYKKPRIFLCEVDKERICQLETTNTSGTFKFNSYSEITFDVDRLYNNVITGETKVNPHYNKIESPRLIEIENIGYFELQGPELSSDGIKETKSCTAYSLEYSLSTKYLTDFIINTGETGSVEVTYAEDVIGNIDDIQPVTLYNPTVPALSLLHLALQPIRGWRIGHVDTSLQTLSRTFEIDRESVYDFLINEVCEKFNCYIIFDTTNNTISVYAESLTAKFIGDGATNTFIISPPFAQIGTVSVGGYKTTRWEYNTSTGALALEDTPESGSHIEVVDGALTEWETDVFVSFENLAQELNINYDADAIKTQLTVSYGDDGNIREANFGLPYLIDISYYYTVDWMGQELYDAYTAYMQKSNGLQSEYTNNSQEISIINDQIYYEETRLSLEFSVVNSVNSTTVGTYYVKQGEEGNYYYKEVSLPGEYDANETYYSNATVNVTEEKMTNLFSVFKKYFHNENDDGDKITSWKTDLNKLSDDFKFMKIYTIDYLSAELSKVSENRTDENTNSAATTAINNFLSEVWSELGRTPLQQLYLEPYKKIQATNVEAGWSNVQDEKYGYYYPVLLMISSIEAAIAIRDNTIANYENQREVFYAANNAISDSLSMDNEANFSEEQLIRLSAFLREDELHLDDIVETSEDNLSSSFKVKQDAMESGRIELQKLCQPQLQFSMSMANIYALPEFEPIIDQFQLGKVIKVALRDDYIKQSRLLQVNIGFDDFSDFSCEFGDLTNLRTQSDIHADLLKNAITAGKSVATNSGRWTKGADTITSIDLRIQQGLLDANTQIKAIDGTQGVVIDKYGIWLKKKDENGNIDPHQTRLVNNMIIMSDDGFKTSKTALGQVTVDGNTYYGLLAEIMMAGYIGGSTIEGGTIKIGEYIDPIDGKKKYHFKVDQDGNVTMQQSNITGYVKTEDLVQFETEITEEFQGKIDAIQNQEDGSITTWFYDEAPDVNKLPASDWNTDEIKAMHVGDIYYNTWTGDCYEWTEKDGVYSWEQTLDNGLAEAMKAASTAKDVADGKRRVFVEQPTPPYDVGDLWTEGAGGDLKRCKISKKSGESFSKDDWELATRSLNEFISGTYADDLKDIQDQIDRKAETWYQATDPSTQWKDDNTKALHVGDLWHYTGETGEVNGTQRTKNSEWVWKKTDNTYQWGLIEVSDVVFDTIDGVASIYIEMPQNPVIGDLLIPLEDIRYDGMSYKQGKVYRYDGSAWIEVSYTDDTKANGAYEYASNIEKKLDSITLSVENADGKGATIKLGIDNKTQDAYIDMTGMVTFNSLEDSTNVTTINGANITTGSIKIGEYVENNTTKYYFTVDSNGYLTATSGNIANWNINTDSIFKVFTNNNIEYQAMIAAPTSFNLNTSAAFAIRTRELNTDGSYKDSWPFYVRYNGEMRAIKGNIAGFTFNSTALYNGTNSLTSTTKGVYVGTDGLRVYGQYGGFTINNIGAEYKSTDGTYLSMSGNHLSLHSFTANNATQYFDISFYNNNSIKGCINHDGIFKPNGTCFIDWSGNIDGKNVTVSGDLEVSGTSIISKKLYAVGGIEITGNLETNGQIVANDQIVVKDQIATKGQNPDGKYYYRTYMNSMNRYSANDTKYFIQAQKSGSANTDGSYNTVYSVNFAGDVKCQTCTDSDERLKYDITNLSEQYSMLFDNLRPVTFKYKHGDSGRAHAGLIAQEVKSAMELAGLSDKDFAAYVREITDDEGLDGYSLALRYSEFIALLINEVQKLKEKVHNLEKETSPQ